MRGLYVDDSTVGVGIEAEVEHFIAVIDRDATKGSLTVFDLSRELLVVPTQTCMRRWPDQTIAQTPLQIFGVSHISLQHDLRYYGPNGRRTNFRTVELVTAPFTSDAVGVSNIFNRLVSLSTALFGRARDDTPVPVSTLTLLDNMVRSAYMQPLAAVKLLDDVLLAYRRLTVDDEAMVSLVDDDECCRYTNMHTGCDALRRRPGRRVGDGPHIVVVTAREMDIEQPTVQVGGGRALVRPRARSRSHPRALAHSPARARALTRTRSRVCAATRR